MSQTVFGVILAAVMMWFVFVVAFTNWFSKLVDHLSDIADKELKEEFDAGFEEHEEKVDESETTESPSVETACEVFGVDEDELTHAMIGHAAAIRYFTSMIARHEAFDTQERTINGVEILGILHPMEPDYLPDYDAEPLPLGMSMGKEAGGSCNKETGAPTCCSCSFSLDREILDELYGVEEYTLVAWRCPDCNDMNLCAGRFSTKEIVDTFSSYGGLSAMGENVFDYPYTEALGMSKYSIEE